MSGKESHPIPARKRVLFRKKEALLTSMQRLQEAVDYIDWKQNFYDECYPERPLITAILFLRRHLLPKIQLPDLDIYAA